MKKRAFLLVFLLLVGNCNAGCSPDFIAKSKTGYKILVSVEILAIAASILGATYGVYGTAKSVKKIIDTQKKIDSLMKDARRKLLVSMQESREKEKKGLQINKREMVMNVIYSNMELSASEEYNDLMSDMSKAFYGVFGNSTLIMACFTTAFVCSLLIALQKLDADFEKGFRH